MKRIITISILVISIISIVLAETNPFYYDYVKDDEKPLIDEMMELCVQLDGYDEEMAND